MPDDHAALREEIRRLGPWHHDLEITPGVRTGDQALAPPADPELGTPSLIRPSEMLVPLTQALFEEGMAGRSFLDCACNAGGHVFTALALGSPRAYGFDVRRHWIDQAEFLARHVPSAGATFGCHDLADLPGLRLEPFDVTLFSGLFYHLPDPVAGLRIAADLTGEVLMINTSALPAPGNALILNTESATDLMSGVHRLAWLPSGRTVVEAILSWCGFPHTELVLDRPATDGHGRRRLFIAAARRPQTLARLRARQAQERRGVGGWMTSAMARLRDRGLAKSR